MDEREKRDFEAGLAADVDAWLERQSPRDETSSPNSDR